MADVSKIAEQKRELARKLFQDGAAADHVRAAVRDKFESGICNNDVYRIKHEVHGTVPHSRGGRKKGGKAAKKKKKKKVNRKSTALARSSLVPIPITMDTAPVSPGTDALLRALVTAMRAEGVDSVYLRADGHGEVRHAVRRTLDLGD